MNIKIYMNMLTIQSMMVNLMDHQVYTINKFTWDADNTLPYLDCE